MTRAAIERSTERTAKCMSYFCHWDVLEKINEFTEEGRRGGGGGGGGRASWTDGEEGGGVRDRKRGWRGDGSEGEGWGRIVCWLVGCLTSQQQASVSQGRICSDNFTCCHTEIEVADQTFYLTQSQYTDTGPTSPRADPITPGAWQGSHWSSNF